MEGEKEMKCYTDFQHFGSFPPSLFIWKIIPALASETKPVLLESLRISVDVAAGPTHALHQGN